MARPGLAGQPTEEPGGESGQPFSDFTPAMAGMEYMSDSEKAAAFDLLALALTNQWYDGRWSWWCRLPCGGPQRVTRSEAIADLVEWAEYESKQKRRPKVFVGEFHGWKLFWLEVMGWGRMFCRDAPKAGYQSEPWAFDNGAFGSWVNEKPWDASAYVRRVKRAVEMRPIEHPFLAVLPDLPTKGMESLAFSQNWLNESYELPIEWPWYLSVQDGMTIDAVDLLLRHGQAGRRRIAGLFLGGSDDFKSTAATWSDYAHSIGLRFHYARCGTIAKLRLAFESNSDSVDSVGIIRNERRDNSFWRYAMEWKHPSAAFNWKSCREMIESK